MKMKSAAAGFALICLGALSSGALAGGGSATWGQFGNNIGPDANNAFSWPDSAESWGGWANTNADIAPMSFPQGGTIRFTASAENGDVSIRFRFERLPFPDLDPAFETESVRFQAVQSPTVFPLLRVRLTKPTVRLSFTPIPETPTSVWPTRL